VKSLYEIFILQGLPLFGMIAKYMVIY